MPELLNYRVSGRPLGSAATLLLIHPMGSALDFWDGCLPIWQEHYTCLALDLRSAGSSPRGDTAPRLEAHVADLAAMRDTLGISRLVPIACAVGTMVAAAYAARYQEHVVAMVLANPTPTTSDIARVMLKERAAAVRAGGMAAILPAAVDRPFAAQTRDTRYEQYFSAFAAQDPGAYANAVDGFAEADARPFLPKVRCPTLLVPASHDLLLPPALAEDVRRLMAPGLARIELDEDGAHFLPYQRPLVFAERAHNFISSCLGG